MTLKNSLLIEAANTWYERTDPVSIAAHRRRETMLAVGAQTNATVIAQVADRVLDIYGDVREQITLGIDSHHDLPKAFPYYLEGDLSTATDSTGASVTEEVVSVTITEDEETGRSIETVVLADQIQSIDEQFMMSIGKMIPGVVVGSSYIGAQPAVRENYNPDKINKLPAPEPVVVAAGHWEIYDGPDDFLNDDGGASEFPFNIGEASGKVYVWGYALLHAYDPGPDSWDDSIALPSPPDPFKVGARTDGLTDWYTVQEVVDLTSDDNKGWIPLKFDTGGGTFGGFPTRAQMPRIPVPGPGVIGGVLCGNCTVAGELYVANTGAGGLYYGFQKYDPLGDSWTSLTDNTLIEDSQMAEWGGNIIAIATDVSLVSHVLKYDVGGDSWTELGAPPLSQWFNPTVVNIGSGLLVGGGQASGTGPQFDYWLYDPDADTWTPVDSPTTAYASLDVIKGGTLGPDGSAYTVSYTGDSGITLFLRYVP